MNAFDELPDAVRAFIEEGERSGPYWQAMHEFVGPVESVRMTTLTRHGARCSCGREFFTCTTATFAEAIAKSHATRMNNKVRAASEDGANR